MPGPGFGILHIVAMPIGNPGDCSPRAREALSRAELILAEDTRRAGLAFQRLGIERTGELVSFYEHNEESRLAGVLAELERGRDVALISDAGTPLLSDPGFRLVAACRQRGVTVTPVPGPCAAVAALSACGLPPQPYTFLGFPPRKAGALKALLTRHRDTGASLVFYERAPRVAVLLAGAAEVLGPRAFCLARELTKTHEEFLTGRLDRPEALPAELKGECTVVIGPEEAVEEGEAAARDDEAVVLALIAEERAAGGKPRQVARRAAARARGWTADAVYEKMQH